MRLAHAGARLIRFARAFAFVSGVTVVACDEPSAPQPLVAVAAELIAGEPGAVAITALAIADDTVWFTCTQPRFVVERRVSGEWVEHQSANGVLCDDAGPFALSPGQDLLQFAQLAEPGTYRFAVFVQSEPDVDADGQRVVSDSLVYGPTAF